MPRSDFDQNHPVAHTIFKQLGGRRFCMMTGATDLTGSPNALSFTLLRPARDGINGVRIVHEQDLYAIEFWRLADRFDDRVLVHQCEGIGVEDLGRVFTEATGLETELGEGPSEIENEGPAI
jgi:hypothetical protein